MITVGWQARKAGGAADVDVIRDQIVLGGEHCNITLHLEPR